MRSWIKAGLIGGAALSLLYLLSYILPTGAIAIAFCCVIVLAYLLAGAGSGALAAHWLPAPRDAGTAAGQGALAGGLAGLIGGVVNGVAVLIQSATFDYAAAVADLPPEMLNLLEQLGVTPDMLQSSGGTASGLLGGACCCGVSVIVALLLGAAGGAIWAAVRPNE